MRRHVLIVVCLAMLQGACTSREDAENMLATFVAMLNGGLVDDYDDYPGKSVEPDRRDGRGNRQGDPNGPAGDGGAVAAAGTGSPGAGAGTSGSASASGSSGTGSPSDSPGLGSGD